ASLARQVARAEDTARDIVDAEKAVSAGADPDEAFPMTPGPMCGWCDFKRSCPSGAGVPTKDQWAGLDRGLAATDA
ncbi:recombinase RecB, partial [Asanoa sp. NPDC050611]